MPSDASKGLALEGEDARLRAARTLHQRACKVAKHLAVVIEELSSQRPCDVDAHADFVDAAFRLLVPEPWLAFVESVDRAVSRCEGAGRDERGDPVPLARRYFDEYYPELAERAWPTRDAGKGRAVLRSAVTAWSRREEEERTWTAIRVAACCFQPDDPEHPEADVPSWDSMRRQWERHARRKLLPPRPSERHTGGAVG
jgi:hypothetical protein